VPEGGSPELLDTKLDIHDQRQFELKLNYQPSGTDPESEYLVETYLFVPRALNITAETWPREDFYGDLHNYVRLKVPVLAFGEILGGAHSPLVHLEERRMLGLMGPESELVYDAKMLSCVFRGALRRFALQMQQRCPQLVRGDPGLSAEDLLKLARHTVEQTREVLQRYRSCIATLQSKYALSPRAQASLRLVDEYLSLTVEQDFRRVVVDMGCMPHTPEFDALRKELMQHVIADEGYRIQHNLTSVISPTSDNEEYSHRLSFLKKFCMNILFLHVQRGSPRKKWEEVLFAVAAGCSMAFALGVALFAQSRYPQASFNFFIIAVMGYMLKDRIKEGLRRLAALYAGKFLYERNTRIMDPVTRDEIGLCREKIDYDRAVKVPDDISAIRAHDDLVTASQGELAETVIRYRKRITLNSEMLPRMGGGIVSGVADIIRLNVHQLLHDMDDPEHAIDYIDLGDYSVEKVKAIKSYRVDVAFRFAVDDGRHKQTALRVVRLILDRNGIKRMIEIGASDTMKPVVSAAA